MAVRRTEESASSAEIDHEVEMQTAMFRLQFHATLVHGFVCGFYTT